MFVNRKQAAGQLAKALAKLRFGDEMALFALPRGGVVLGAEVSKQLKVPLGPLFVSKIGHPLNAEYAIGAVAEDGDPVYNQDEISIADPRWLDRSLHEARNAIAYRRELYCGSNVVTPVAKNRVAVLVDDGMATGLTMAAAVRMVRNAGARQVVVASPVASNESLAELKKFADRVVVLEPPEDFKGSVGAHYQQFDQVNDKEAKKLLAQSFVKLRSNR